MCCKTITQLHAVADLGNLLQIGRLRLYHDKINTKQLLMPYLVEGVEIIERVLFALLSLALPVHRLLVLLRLLLHPLSQS